MRMTPNPSPITFFGLILGVFTFIFVMLLPTLLELIKPKDAGPRIIMDHALLALPEISDITKTSVEEQQRYDLSLAQKIASAIAFLPNIEA